MSMVVAVPRRAVTIRFYAPTRAAVESALLVSALADWRTLVFDRLAKRGEKLSSARLRAMCFRHQLQVTAFRRGAGLLPRLP